MEVYLLISPHHLPLLQKIVPKAGSSKEISATSILAIRKPGIWPGTGAKIKRTLTLLPFSARKITVSSSILQQGLTKGTQRSSGWMAYFSQNLSPTRPPPPSWEKSLSGQTDLKWTTKTGTKYPELVTVAKVMTVLLENPSSPTLICVCMVELVKYGLRSRREKWPLMTTALPGATKKVVQKSYHLYAREPRAQKFDDSINRGSRF